MSPQVARVPSALLGPCKCPFYLGLRSASWLIGVGINKSNLKGALAFTALHKTAHARALVLERGASLIPLFPTAIGRISVRVRVRLLVHGQIVPTSQVPVSLRNGALLLGYDIPRSIPPTCFVFDHADADATRAQWCSPSRSASCTANCSLARRANLFECAYTAPPHPDCALVCFSCW